MIRENSKKKKKFFDGTACKSVVHGFSDSVRQYHWDVGEYRAYVLCNQC